MVRGRKIDGHILERMDQLDRIRNGLGNAGQIADRRFERHRNRKITIFQSQGGEARDGDFLRLAILNAGRGFFDRDIDFTIVSAMGRITKLYRSRRSPPSPAPCRSVP